VCITSAYITSKISANTSEESVERLHRCWWTRRYV